jgi:thimet oligopeptidase
MRPRFAPLAVLLFSVAARPLSAQEPELRFDRLAPADLEARTDRILASANRSLERVLALRGPRTVANTLRPYDDFRIEVNAARVVSFLRTVHPDSAIRAAAARAEDRLATFNERWRADRRVYEMLAAVDTVGADAEVRFWLRRELDRFRREYVDYDETTRARAAALRQQLNRLEQRWGENLRHDTITVAFDSVALTGMSPAWIAARPRGPRGEILVSGDELRTVTSQASSGATRERALVLSFRPRRNHFLLDTLLRTRHALATLLGARSWAQYQFRDDMVGSPDRVRAFLNDARRLSEPALRRAIESRLGESGGSAGSNGAAGGGAPRSIPLHDLLYGGPAPANSSLRPEAALRPYLPYSRVRDGMLDLARELMGLEFRPAPDLAVWEPTVEPYRVLENGRLIARVYLDVHFRPGKSSRGASAANFRLGVRDRAITEAAIVGGMIRARPGDPELMGPQGVVMLFHEFGHLLHYLVSVRSWFATSGLPDEFDFREVPSILFAEWGRDPAVLRRFARHYQTGEAPPAELLEQARTEGREEGGFMAQWLSRMSLELHDRPPGDIQAVVREAFAETLPPGLPVTVRLPEGDIHPEVSVPHLGSYAAAYYTYLWSAAIAEDLLTRFDKGLLDPVAVRAYRVQILEPGRSRPAMELIEAFLGRPFSLDAWARSLAR